MRQMFAILAPAFAGLTVLLLFGGAPSASGKPPSEPAPQALAWLPPTTSPGAKGHEVAAQEEEPVSLQPPTPGEEAGPEGRVAALLREIRAWTAAGITDSPDVLIREVVALIDEHPHTADLFLAAIGDMGRPEWTILGGAFVMLADPDLRMRIVLAHRAADPFRARLAETLTDERRIVDALRDGSGGEFRRFVLDSAPLEGMVLEEVRRIAISAPEERLRARAIHRLGSHDDAGSLALVLSILACESGSDSDRMAAAFALSYRTGPEIKRAWLDILERGDSIPILAHAARGLTPYVGEPGVQDALLREVSRSTAPDVVRQEAATALSRGWNRLSDPEKSVVFGGIQNVVRLLPQEPSSEELRKLLDLEFGRKNPGISPDRGTQEDPAASPVFQWAKVTR